MSTLSGVRGWVIDVDGCLVRTSRAGGADGVAIPGAAEVLDALHRRGDRVLVCTNASEQPPAVYAEHLRELGLPVRDEDFVTAGSAGADHIATHHPDGTVVAVGGRGITQPLAQRGLTLSDGRVPEECAAVLVGAARAYTRDEINTACLAVQAGATLYVTQNQPWFHGGNERSVAISALVAAAITRATGVEPVVTGKPSPVLAEALLDRLGVAAQEAAVVGDAAAEIELARAMGATSISVLSGALSAADIDDLDTVARPDFVFTDIADLHRQLRGHAASPSGVLS